MKRTFLRITSVALVLLLLFAASGCTSKKEITDPDFAWDGTGEEMYQYAVDHGFVVCKEYDIEKNLSVWIDSYAKILKGEETTVYLAHFKDDQSKGDKQWILSYVSLLYFDGERYHYRTYFDGKEISNDIFLYMYHYPGYISYKDYYCSSFILSNESILSYDYLLNTPLVDSKGNIREDPYRTICEYTYNLPADIH